MSNWYIGDDLGCFGAPDHGCVCALGTAKAYPLRVVFTSDPRRRIYDMQPEHFEKVYVHQALWAPALLARRLEHEMHRLLDTANKRILGKWFAVNLEWFGKVADVACANLGIEALDHEEFALKVDSERFALADLDLS